MRRLTKKRLAALALLACLSGAGVVYSADFEAARKAMVTSLRAQGIGHAKVLAAMGAVPRHLFVAESQRAKAYSEAEIPVAAGEVMPGPYLTALMLQTLDPKPDGNVLEIGTGSGYQTALLTQLASKVYTVERESRLAREASQRLQSLGYKNVQCGVGEEARGWPAHAPYDCIVVTCATDRVPDALVAQLADGGCLVLAIGRGPEQTLDRMRKRGGKLRVEAVIPVQVSASPHRPRAR